MGLKIVTISGCSSYPFSDGRRKIGATIYHEEFNILTIKDIESANVGQLRNTKQDKQSRVTIDVTFGSIAWCNHGSQLCGAFWGEEIGRENKWGLV